MNLFFFQQVSYRCWDLILIYKTENNLSNLNYQKNSLYNKWIFSRHHDLNWSFHDHSDYEADDTNQLFHEQAESISDQNLAILLSILSRYSASIQLIEYSSQCTVSSAQQDHWLQEMTAEKYTWKYWQWDSHLSYHCDQDVIWFSE